MEELTSSFQRLSLSDHLSTSMRKPKGFRFLDLPAEIRVKIYRELVLSKKVRSCVRNPSWKPCKEVWMAEYSTFNTFPLPHPPIQATNPWIIRYNFQTSIIRVNRQIFVESKAIFYRCNSWIFVAVNLPQYGEMLVKAGFGIVSHRQPHFFRKALLNHTLMRVKATFCGGEASAAASRFFILQEDLGDFVRAMLRSFPCGSLEVMLSLKPPPYFTSKWKHQREKSLLLPFLRLRRTRRWEKMEIDIRDSRHPGVDENFFASLSAPVVFAVEEQKLSDKALALGKLEGDNSDVVDESLQQWIADYADVCFRFNMGVYQISKEQWNQLHLLGCSAVAYLVLIKLGLAKYCYVLVDIFTFARRNYDSPIVLQCCETFFTSFKWAITTYGVSLLLSGFREGLTDEEEEVRKVQSQMDPNGAMIRLLKLVMNRKNETKIDLKKERKALGILCLEF